MNSQLYSAEYVLPGHPDKLSDAIADALVQEASRREKRALVGVEAAAHRSAVFLTGRIACHDAESIDVDELVRDVYRTAGYGGAWHPLPDEIAIHKDLCIGPLADGESEFRACSDDQSIVTGYAVDLPGTNYLPPEHWLANRIGRRLENLRGEREDLQLGPDGKLIVLLERNERASRLAAFSTSLQHPIGGDSIELRRAVLAVLEDELQAASRSIPNFSPDLPDEIVVNGAGNFAVGGPEGDNGLTGKKLVVDAYGPGVPIGGGALSGKDFFKVDRAGAILARRLAKTVLLTGGAIQCHVTLAFFPGDRDARLLSVRNERGEELNHSRWARLLDLSLAGAGERWTGKTDLLEVARHGHFTQGDRPWESIRIDMALPTAS